MYWYGYALAGSVSARSFSARFSCSMRLMGGTKRTCWSANCLSAGLLKLAMTPSFPDEPLRRYRPDRVFVHHLQVLRQKMIIVTENRQGFSTHYPTGCFT